MSELIYIASPYTHKNSTQVDLNFLKITEYCAQKVSEGEVVLSPVTYGHVLSSKKDMPTDWEFWKNFCLTILASCSTLRVVRMPGWDESTGVAAEIEFAEENGLDIEYVDIE